MDLIRSTALSRQKDTLVQHYDAVIVQHKKALTVLRNAMAYEAEARVEEDSVKIKA